MHRKALVAFAAALVFSALAPAAVLATGTATPPLGPNDHQAYVAEADDPIGGTADLSGPLAINDRFGGTCSYDFDISYEDDGTATVDDFSTSDCVVNGYPNCTMTTTPTDLPWGARLVHDTNDGKDRLRMNMRFAITMHQGTWTCPVPAGTYQGVGALSPSLSFSGGVLTASFGLGSGNWSWVWGTGSAIGSVSGTPTTGDSIVY